MVRVGLGVVASLLAAALALAGCAEGPDDGGTGGAAADAARAEDRVEAADEAAAQVEVEATATTGIIRGVAVDEAIRPLAGIVVSVEGTELAQTTGATGAFGFEDLPAGTVFLAASHEAFHPVRLGVVVVAGEQEPEPTRLVLQAIPGREPFIESFQADLFVALSAPLVGSLAPSDAGLEGDDRATFAMSPNASVVQMEVTWEATAPTGQLIRMYGSVTDEATPLEIRSIEGPSPLLLRNNGTVEDDVADGFYFGVGSLSRGFTSTEPPEPNGYLVVNQPFQGFAHAFHNFLPADGWLFVRDGAHAVPP